ncbi:unnamed protein product [Soboliphyme baturini]|uniref:Post-SET domain-containing protein n=1 Tax=Soboliphyme baturini TaxID=241478 RepID=A0A183IGD2_9BILA|nr:unnamed protein product [Soboliphyme baturini]
MGNNSRFMNHSCDPNCRSEVWQVGNDIRIGEELTFHYNLDSTITDLKETKCHCGSKNCRGVIVCLSSLHANFAIDMCHVSNKYAQSENSNIICYMVLPITIIYYLFLWHLTAAP